MQIREITINDGLLVRPLFRQVFGTDITEPMLAWKYGGGAGRSYGAFAPDARLLAHCGVFYRSVLAEGQQRRIAQLGDLMALPGRYGGLSRARSPFALLIKRVLADLSDTDNPDGLAFGFPSDRAMRLGEHLGLFASIDQMCELTFTPLPKRWHTDRCKEIDPSDSAFTRISDYLWQQMAVDLGNGLIGVRDAAYLRHRYFQHPDINYSCYLIASRWFGRPLGMLIIRRDGELCELLDIIAPCTAMPGLLQAVRRQMAGWGVGIMKLWLTKQHAEMLRSQAETVNQLEIRIMASPFSSSNHPERFAKRWWLTSGDTDYH